MENETVITNIDKTIFLLTEMIKRLNSLANSDKEFIFTLNEYFEIIIEVATKIDENYNKV